MLQQKGLLRANDKEPEIGPFFIYTEYFRELSTCRPSGMGLAPIPFTDIYNFAKIKEIEDFDEFLYLMRCLDDAYLKEKAKEDRPNGTTNPNKSNSNKGGRKR